MEVTSLDAGECRAPRAENDDLAEGKILFLAYIAKLCYNVFQGGMKVHHEIPHVCTILHFHSAQVTTAHSSCGTSRHTARKFWRMSTRPVSSTF